MSFQMRVDARSRKAARFISNVHRHLQQAFVRASETQGMTQQKLASKMEVDRSFVNRKLSGEGNLTLRTIADFAWALDCDIEFSFVPTRSASSNYLPRDLVIAAPTTKARAIVRPNTSPMSNRQPVKVHVDA